MRNLLQLFDYCSQNEMNTCRLFARMTKEDSAGRSIVYKKTHIEQYNRHREIVYGGSSDSIRHKRYSLFTLKIPYNFDSCVR